MPQYYAQKDFKKDDLNIFSSSVKLQTRRVEKEIKQSKFMFLNFKLILKPTNYLLTQRLCCVILQLHLMLKVCCLILYHSRISIQE